MKRAKKSSTAQSVGRSGRTGCWAVWMPIETAPHDNATWVLVWDGDQIDIAIFGRHPLDVQEEMALCWTDGGRELNPTHWMPLPDPPNTQAHGRAVARTVQPLVGHSESEGKP